MTYGPELEISKELHATKYRSAGETFEECMNRISNFLKDDDEHYRKSRDMLLNQRFLPGGRIQAAVGTPRVVTPYNCFVSGTIPDSMNGIMDRAKEAAITMRMGGGIGYDFSTLRPRGAHISSLDAPSSGPITFMEIFDSVCKTISSAGNRRGAQMGILRVDHPDIEEFINAKQNTDKLTQFNISVAVTDEFMECLRTGHPFELTFKGKVYRRVNAANLWDKLMRSTWEYAEPGVLFIDTINRKNNLWYTEKIAATNPCVTGETPILTSEGWKRIDSVVNQEVSIWNGKQWSVVTPKVTGENQEIVSVSFSNGRVIECTPYHKFILADGRRIEAKDLVIGNKLERTIWPVVEAGNDVDEAYAQGFFSGDGWVDSRGHCYVGLYGEKKALVEEFKNRISVRNYAISGGYEGTDTSKTKDYVYLGVNTMRDKNFVPDCSWSVKSRLEWLAGIADSDGTVDRTGKTITIQISAKSLSFLSDIQLMLNTLGVSSSLGAMKEYWRLVITSFGVSSLVSIGFSPRRLNLSNNNPSRDSSRFVSVVKIEKKADIAEKVYCFNEPYNHSGTFNGITTAQCAEQPLGAYSACLLGSFNMVKYLTDKSFNFELFKEDINLAVRMMDNIIDRAVYPLPEQEKEAKNKRRMGLGLTGVANALEFLGLSYASPEFLAKLEEIMGFLRDHAYATSAHIASEKGSFPVYDKQKYLYDGEFTKTLSPWVKELIETNGIRNSHLLSIAPTGTISLCADNVSSGIEPPFAHYYDRTIRTHDGEKVERVEDYAYRVWGIKGKTANETTAMEHVSVLNVASKYVDSAVSKTCNVGDGVTWEEFKKIYIAAYEGGSSGCTTFRAAGKRYGILNAAKEETFKEGAACYIDPATGKKTCE